MIDGEYGDANDIYMQVHVLIFHAFIMPFQGAANWDTSYNKCKLKVATKLAESQNSLHMHLKQTLFSLSQPLSWPRGEGDHVRNI